MALEVLEAQLTYNDPLITLERPQRIQLIGIVQDALCVYIDKTNALTIRVLKNKAEHKYFIPDGGVKTELEVRVRNLFFVNFYYNNTLISKYVFKYEVNEAIFSLSLNARDLSIGTPVPGGGFGSILILQKSCLQIFKHQEEENNALVIHETFKFQTPENQLKAYSVTPDGTALFYMPTMDPSLNSAILLFPTNKLDWTRDYQSIEIKPQSIKNLSIHSVSILGPHAYLICSKKTSTEEFFLYQFPVELRERQPKGCTRILEGFSRVFEIQSQGFFSKERDIGQMRLMECKMYYGFSIFLFRWEPSHWAIARTFFGEVKMLPISNDITHMKLINFGYLSWKNSHQGVQECTRVAYSPHSIEKITSLRIPEGFTHFETQWSDKYLLTNKLKDHLVLNFIENKLEKLSPPLFLEGETPLFFNGDYLAYLESSRSIDQQIFRIEKVQKNINSWFAPQTLLKMEDYKGDVNFAPIINTQQVETSSTFVPSKLRLSFSEPKEGKEKKSSSSALVSSPIGSSSTLLNLEIGAGEEGVLSYESLGNGCDLLTNNEGLPVLDLSFMDDDGELF